MSKVEFEVVVASGRGGSISNRLLKSEEWISEPYCRYPQVIIVRFKPTQVTRIELLIHRKFIPSRMDLYAANSQFNSIPAVHLFNVLGNIAFKEKKSDTGRHELKTIFVDIKATYLKFSFGRNYNSIANPKNQIGIVELNIFGSDPSELADVPLGDTASTVSIYRPRATSRRSNFSSTRSSSTSSSLSTSSIWRIASRQSHGSNEFRTPSKQSRAISELRDVLRRAELTKINAIEEENFALAKTARRAEIQIELILKQIKDVERAKQRAIEEEEYDRAQELTDQIKALHENAFEQVDIKFLNAIPNDPQPSSSQTTRTSTTSMSSLTSASSILRQYQEGSLRIDSTPPPNTVVASSFQPIPLTPSTIISEYPRAEELPPKTQSSLASTTISFYHPESERRITSNASYSSNSRKSVISSQNLTPSPHPDPQPLESPSNNAAIETRPILPDSRLPNIRRLSDPTVYRTDDNNPLNSAISNSISSKLSSVFQPNKKPANNGQSPSIQPREPAEQPRNRFLEKENQVVPGAKRRKSAESMTLDSLLDNLHPSERQIATQAIDIFGLKTISKIYSRNYQDRRQGYLQIQQSLSEQPFSRTKSKDITRVVESLVARGLSEKPFSVYSVVLDLLKHLLGTYVVQNGLVDSDGPRIVNSTHQMLVNRTGDTVNEKRFATSTFNAVSSLLHGDFRVANYYMLKFLQPFDSTHSVRTDQGKAQIVYNGVVDLYGAKLSSLSTKNVCQFALECLNHTDAKVRDYGRKIILFMYEREDRQLIRGLLPKGNAAKRIPAVRNLLDDLDKIDGSFKILASSGPSPNPIRQTRFDTNPTIINETGGKKKRGRSIGTVRSPNRSSPGNQDKQPQSNNVRLVVDKKKEEEEDKDSSDYNKRQPRPESDARSDSLFSLPVLRSILKNK